MVSALTGDGLADLLDYLAAAMPEGPCLYPEDQMTDLPLRFLAAEITREKLTLRLHEELPYRSTVETEKWTETKKGVRIDQTIYVERDSQRKIVLGKGGADDQGDLDGRAGGDRKADREAGAPLPVREGARELDRRPGALPGDGRGVSEVARLPRLA